MSKTVTTVAGDFNFERAKQFRKAFIAASGADFEFEGQPVVNGFAKYLVEYLESHFDLKSED